jgi:hypothetical protein
MTRSKFDPDGGETERSGSTFLGPEGSNASHLPPDVTDGQAQDDVGMTVEGAERVEDTESTVAPDADEAARRLRKMTDAN